VAGFSNKEIAEYFNISEDTVKHHLSNIFDRLGVSTCLELALRASGWSGGPEDGDAAGVAVKKPRSPNLNMLRLIREVRPLMVNLLSTPDSQILRAKGIVKTLYDPACGTSRMLSVAEENYGI
jgi:hypothetical protein